MSENNTNKIDCWALVELMGHMRIAGRVTEQPVGGVSLIRVDVPDTDGNTAYTRMYGAAAIYCISPMNKELVVKLAQQIRAVPVTEYDLPRQLTATTEHCPQCGRIEDECSCPEVDDDDGCINCGDPSDNNAVF